MNNMLLNSVILLALCNLAVAQSGKPVSRNARCGNGFGTTCQGSKWGNCCSQYGYCGSTKDYCDVANKCQKDFGSCDGQPISSRTSARTTLSTSIRISSSSIRSTPPSPSSSALPSLSSSSSSPISSSSAAPSQASASVAASTQSGSIISSAPPASGTCSAITVTESPSASVSTVTLAGDLLTITQIATLPASTFTLPAVTETLPAVTETLPAVTQTLPAVTETLPAVTVTLPAITETLPAVTLPAVTLPVVTETLPAVTETLPAVTETLPAVTETLPAVTQTLPPVTETLPAVTETLPANTITLPAVTETLPAVTVTLPASTQTLPAVTVTQTASTSCPASCPTGDPVVNGGFDSTLSGTWSVLIAGDADIERVSVPGGTALRSRINSGNGNLAQRVIQAVTVCPGVNYQVSFSARRVTTSGTVSAVLYINDTPLAGGTITATSFTPVSVINSGIFSTTSRSVTLRMEFTYSQNTGIQKEIQVDDISLRRL